MDAAETILGIAQLISQLGNLAVQAQQAASAGDQTTLDTIKNQVVATSNALAPAGAVIQAVS